MSKSKKLLNKLRKIKSMKDLETLKLKLEKKVKKENKPLKIVLEFTFSNEEKEKTIYKNVYQFISKTIGFKGELPLKNDYTTLANIINQYCIDNNIKDPEDNFFYYSEKEIKKNKIIHVVRWYLETTDKEYVSLFMDYKG